MKLIWLSLWLGYSSMLLLSDPQEETLLALNHVRQTDLLELKENLIDFSPSLAHTSKPGLNQLLSPDTTNQKSHVVLQAQTARPAP